MNLRLCIIISYILIFIHISLACSGVDSVSFRALDRFISKPMFAGASLSVMVQDVLSGEEVLCYDIDRELVPASVLKSVVTASALEILGGDYCFATSIAYSGEIRDGVLYGDIYIIGGGDPTLNSSKSANPRDKIIKIWYDSIRNLGIREVRGGVIADGSIFDLEGVSMKWLREDLGSGYGQGCYGLNIFDNQMYVYIRPEVSGRARVMFSEPGLSDIKFHNFLSVLPNIKDSCYITGFPFSSERYLNGVIRYRRGLYRMRGDLPDPESYTSSYFTQYLRGHGIKVVGESSSQRLLKAAGLWRELDRHVIVTTYSESLKDIIRTTNFFSPNLYADALLRAIGLRYVSGGNESLTSVERGVRVLKRYWDSCGISTSSLWMYDGSGLAVTNKLTARFLCAIYSYMSTCSVNASTYYSSLPRAGYEGTVRSFRLFRPALFGKIRLKSGSMSRVRCYGGYVTYGGRRYAITILINNYSGSPSFVRASIEELLSIIFR